MSNWASSVMAQSCLHAASEKHHLPNSGVFLLTPTPQSLSFYLAQSESACQPGRYFIRGCVGTIRRQGSSLGLDVNVDL